MMLATTSDFDLIQEKLAFKPLGYAVARDIPAPSQPFQITSDFQKTTINQIPLMAIKLSADKQLKFLKPIVLKIGPSEDGFFAENESLGIFVHGDSIKEVQTEFVGDLIHFFNHYSKTKPDMVIGDAKRLRNIYTTLMHEE